ncbi:MAG: hypothetical protein Q7U04_05485 [Bacteriovorax sp.]|nr:hypothetical protein [Bacteriovorax sp.]
MLKIGFMFCMGLFVMSSQIAFGDETVGEKINVSANNSKRAMKKGVHRLNEALCSADDLKCAGEKIKNRAVEVEDAATDGAKKIKNKID